ARPLERIVWLLAARSELWEQLPAHCHELLCEQAGVFGDFFRWLDRLLLQEGPLAADALHEQMRQALPEDGQDLPFTHLLKRIEDFHDVLSGDENLDELLGLVKPLQLQAINDELELLTQSGDLSEAAKARELDLIRQSLALKLELSQKRPISGS